jgi:transposase-like protein
MYDKVISHATLSAITYKIIPEIKEWQSRPLENFFTLVHLDAMHDKVKEKGRIVSYTVDNILSVNRLGRKELLSMHVSESEGAHFWLSALIDLKYRGVPDILIACTDNLKGFSEAIESLFTQTEIKTCIVHQIRNSLKYVSYKDCKAFMKNLKPVYHAATKELAELRLIKLEDRWGKKYPVVLQSWHNNWHKLSTYFFCNASIRRLIYIANTIKGFHRQIRKVTETKGAFTSVMALIMLIYLAHGNISQKWTTPLINWAQTAVHLSIWFEGRIKIDLTL